MKKLFILIVICCTLLIGCNKKSKEIVWKDTLEFNLYNRYITFIFSNNEIKSVSLKIPFDSKKEVDEYVEGIKKDNTYKIMYEDINIKETTLYLNYNETYYKEVYGNYNQEEVYNNMIKNGYSYVD